MDSLHQKNRDEFIAQLAAHQRRLYQYIFTLLPREHDADNVMQDTLMVLWQKFEQFDAATNFFAWAKRVAYLQTQNYRRRNSRLITVLADNVFEEIASRIESHSDVLQARQDAIVRCAERLGPADHVLLNLRYLPGATIKSIARQLGRPANSVRTSLAQIRRALWECVRAEIVAVETYQAKEGER